MAEKKVCADRFVGYKFVGRVIGLGAWSIEHGAWSIEHGAWSMEHGA